jgi:DNA invertase Pin-like site-specific DNA recombinase
MTSALLYTRVSKDRKQSRSTAEQEAECRAVCEREGWQVADVLSDDGRSASRYAKRGRPAWDEVKHRLATDGIDVLVTWEASRSSRDLAGFVELRDICQEHGVKLSYKGGLLDLDATNDRFEAGLHALLAERESDETRDRILRTVRANAKDGRPHGRKLYGYKRRYDPETGGLLGQEPDEAEAAVVREVARRFLAGESAGSIAADLNAREVPFATDAAWSETRIKRMVTNVGYVGRRVFRGEDVGPADWPAILDQETHDACVAKFDDPARRQTRSGNDVRHLLSGIARCGKCGQPMYRTTVGQGVGTYECSTGGGHLARNQSHLDAYVIVVLLERLRDVDLDDLDGDGAELAEARHEADELRQRLNGAVAEFTAGRLSAGLLSKAEANLEPRIADAERRARPTPISPLVTEVAGKDVDARWDRLTIEQQREVIRTLLDVVVLPDPRPRGSRGFDPASVRITFRR